MKKILSSTTLVMSILYSTISFAHLNQLPKNRTPSMSNLYSSMQTLWAQHMEWTYSAVVALVTNPPAVNATVGRLLKNQEDIGNAIMPFYGESAGHALTKLLKEHIAGAVAVVNAAKADDKLALEKAVDAAYANAQEIGDFLSSANPNNWKQEGMRSMLKGHIDTTLVYATSLIKGNYTNAIAEYEIAEAHMLHMAEELSAGIIAQFPKKFKK